MKKAIKIALMILLIASMVFMITGCGYEKLYTARDDDEDFLTDDDEDFLTDDDEDFLTDDDEEELEDEEQEESKVEFSMGEWKGNVYENEFLGLKFNLPNGWTYSSDEEIAETMNIGTELLNDDQKYAAEVSKLTSAYYMLAKNPTTGENVTVLSEKPLVDVTTEYYLDQLETQLAAVNSINYEIGETSKENVAGREYSTLTVTASMSGVELTQKYFVYKMDNYFIGIIATSANGESGINEIMKAFK